MYSFIDSMLEIGHTSKFKEVCFRYFGFIKDIPLNKNRNFGLGIGIGGSLNSFNQNLLVDKIEGGT